MTEKTKRPDPFEGLLTAEEIEVINKWQVANERKARRRRPPSWNPDTDPPWRSLEDCFIAALKGCDRLSTSDLETVIARGEAWITGTRDDVIGDFLPNRIEALIAAAERRYFVFDSNSITATYSKPPPDSYRALITFKSVKVHWPMLVEALQTAGFEISATPKQAKPRGGPPPPATQSVAAETQTNNRKATARTPTITPGDTQRILKKLGPMPAGKAWDAVKDEVKEAVKNGAPDKHVPRSRIRAAIKALGWERRRGKPGNNTPE